jgi:DNA polymerase-1
MEEEITQRLARKFEETKITPRGKGKPFILVDNKPHTWIQFRNLELKDFKALYPKPKLPKNMDETINLGSPAQLKEAVSAMIGEELLSTDREHLVPFAHDYPIIKKLLTWKELDKFINAFGEKLLARIEDDHRIHPTYNQIGAATGRMSCSSPNWQQIPAHEPDETSVRKCVIAEPGNMLLTADFSNIELRILAEVSQDTSMLKLFAEGADLHSRTAMIMFDLPDGTDPKKTELKPGLSYRQIAKVINFGLVYGMSPVKLSHMLGVSKEEAETLFHRYFDAYPGVSKWLEEASKEALEKGYSVTLAGRKRFYDVLPSPIYDPSVMSRETYRQQQSMYFRVNGSYERKAKNAPIQGSNADITKLALAFLYRHLPAHTKIAACVHDELVLETPVTHAKETAKLLAWCMEKACKKFLHTVHVPPVDVEIETYWKKG